MNGIPEPELEELADSLEEPGGFDWRKLMLFLIRLGLTLALIGFVAVHADGTAVLKRLADARPGPLVLAVLVMALALAAMGLRWSAALRLFPVGLPVAAAVRFTLVGLFLGLVLPGGIGGDTVRGWYAYRTGVRLRVVAASLVLDRVLTLLAIFVLIFLSFLLLQEVMSGEALIQISLIIAIINAGMALALLLDRVRLPSRLTRGKAGRLLGMLADIRRALLTWDCLRPFGWALLIHGLVILTTVLLADGFNLPVSPLTCLAVMPVTILGISLPISINGWGVREGTMVAMLGFYAVPVSDALLLALALGLVNILAALPGGMLWLTSAAIARTGTTN